MAVRIPIGADCSGHEMHQGLLFGTWRSLVRQGTIICIRECIGPREAKTRHVDQSILTRRRNC